MICVWVWAMSSEWRSEDNFWDCVLSLSLYYKLNSGCQAVREELCPLRHLTVLKQYLLKWKYHSLCEQKLPVKRQKNSSHWLYVPRKRNSVLGAQWGEQVWEAPGGTRYSPLSSMLLVVGVSVLGSALTWTRNIYENSFAHLPLLTAQCQSWSMCRDLLPVTSTLKCPSAPAPSTPACFFYLGAGSAFALFIWLFIPPRFLLVLPGCKLELFKTASSFPVTGVLFTLIYWSKNPFNGALVAWINGCPSPIA